MALHHKQTMLILNNASVPVNNEPETYTSVMKAWNTALVAMNNLVKGIPQRVQDGAALLAISSWHLYPDMFVGKCCIEVKQKDPLFEKSALLTLGLQHVRDEVKSVYWSLPLACLQYYGHPAQASRSTGDNSRISCHQFAYVVISCVFSGWKGYAATNEQGLVWLRRLADILSLSTQHRFDHARKPTWLIYLTAAVQEYEELEQSEMALNNQLMNLGRRYPVFLHWHQMVPPPLFGLSQMHVLISILKNDHERVLFLRQLCTHLKLDPSIFFIKYRPSVGGVEYASVTPLRQISTKRMSDGTLKKPEGISENHIRWISLNYDQLLLLDRRAEDYNNVDQAIMKLQALQQHAHAEKNSRVSRSYNGAETGFSLVDTTVENKRSAEIRDLKKIIVIARRRLEIEQMGELFLPAIEYLPNPGHCHFADRNSHHNLEPSLILPTSLDFLKASKELLGRMNDPHLYKAGIPQSFFTGDSSIAGLYCCKKHRQGPNLIPEPNFLEQFFTSEKLLPEKIYFHFSHSHECVQSEMSCLRGCAKMAEIYQLLPGATISTLAVKICCGLEKYG